MPSARSAFLATTIGVGVILAGAVPAEAAPAEPSTAVALPAHHHGDQNEGGGSTGGSGGGGGFTPSPSTHMRPHQHPQTEKLARQIIRYVRSQIAEYRHGSGGNNGGDTCATCVPSPSTHLKSK